MSDPKFKELHDTSESLRLLGDTPTDYRTFATTIESIDNELRKKTGKSLAEVNWKKEKVDQAAGMQTAAYSLEIAGLRLVKTYTVRKIEGDDLPRLRREAVAGYLVDCRMTFRNTSAEHREIVYQLQGPVGVRLENEEHARKYRDIQVAFVGDDDDDDDTLTAKAIVDQKHENELEKWKQDFRYIGVDNQYFAALILKSAENRPAIALVEPQVIDEHPKQPAWSDISLTLTSEPLKLTPGGEPVVHDFQMYFGPKRRELLDQEPLQASRVLNYGITGWVARGMLSLLSTFHHAGLPYGLAIILLTVLVRGCMFPLSRKQVRSANKMKELQPQIQALKEKFGDDREKMAKAQMELFAKHKYNPFAGCLPLFLQFPIFIGLYTALYASIDLRLAPFLWIDDLSRPDSLFRMPFRLPFLGQDFSILPIITVVLFITQQKMFMPPATTPEQAMQQKMMSWMTILFGFFFWHSPAGLCVYFIASSLWGLTERKLLSKESPDPPSTAADTDRKHEPVSRLAADTKPEKKRKMPGFLERLAEAAEAAKETNTQTRRDRNGKRKKKRR